MGVHECRAPYLINAPQPETFLQATLITLFFMVFSPKIVGFFSTRTEKNLIKKFNGRRNSLAGPAV